MPTQETWLEDHIILTTWQAPLTRFELRDCFIKLADWLDSRAEETHILFDLTHAGPVPNSAPISAIRSGFLTNDNTGRVAVIGMEKGPQALARVAANVTRKTIQFFPDKDNAIDYLLNADY